MAQKMQTFTKYGFYAGSLERAVLSLPFIAKVPKCRELSPTGK
nr:MAG TPA: hypothetical protein [Caudoviricetes sp.]